MRGGKSSIVIEQWRGSGGYLFVKNEQRRQDIIVWYALTPEEQSRVRVWVDPATPPLNDRSWVRRLFLPATHPLDGFSPDVVITDDLPVRK